ncbi:alpha/beta hydrolase [Pseudonocardia sp.]|uniref:alpha/beta fold hydrolase n=1 Tax=Pseudonocardia sp. TaxID=60912 RepID=UPI002621AF69|nr:alpha/beta hydrolase [Pseudonocardia sp.]
MRRTVRADDGIELAVVEFGGDGPPILLLHGLMGRASTWCAVARWLTTHGRVVGLDARGHGGSGAAGPWTVERMVTDAAGALEALGRATVIGHSMGGLHGIALAARHPELVRALVVEDMGVDFRGHSAADARAWFGALPAVFGSLAEVRATFGWPRPEFGEYMAGCVEERADGYHLLASVEHATQIAAEWAARDFGALLDDVRCPALLVEAEQSVAPPGQMAAMAARLPAGRHVRIPGTGHLVHAAAPGAYRRAVEPFVGVPGS